MVEIASVQMVEIASVQEEADRIRAKLMETNQNQAEIVKKH